MIDGAGVSSTAQALGMLGVVLLEATALYLGYGAVEQRLAPSVVETLKDA